MELVWLGHACFRLRSRDVTVLTDPFQRSVGYQLGRPTADIVTISHDHPGHNNIAAVGSEPRVIRGPGEYEVKGVAIVGVQTYHDAENGKRRGKNTAYVIGLDDVMVGHLGDLGHVLAEGQVEAMSNVDVLLVPVGGHTTIDASQAAEVISLLEPKVIVPMHYHTDALSPKLTLDSVDKFCREMGVRNLAAQPKLNLTRSGLPDEAQVVILEYRRGS